MTIGPLTIDTARRLVFVAGERVDLTKREFDLLAALAEKPVRHRDCIARDQMKNYVNQKVRQATWNE